MKNWKEELKTLKQERARRTIAHKGLTDLIYLTQEILYPLNEERKPLGRMHKRVVGFLNTLEERRKLKTGKKIIGILLLPREHLKSTLVTISWSIQKVLENPNIRIMLSNEKLANSQKFLDSIKQQFEKNDVLRYVYGDFVPTGDEKWTQDEITVSKRTSIGVKEPTIQCGSLTSSLVSAHFDILIFDDLVSRDNVGTLEQIEKVWQYWTDALSLGTDDSIFIDVGTRWDDDDLHGRLIKLAKTHPNDYEFLIESCYEVDEGLDADGQEIVSIKEPKQVSWPEGKTIQQFEQIRGPSENDFWALYMNHPTSTLTADFKPEWFQKRYKEEDLKSKILRTFLTLDNAPSIRKGTDFIGCIVNSVDSSGNWYLRWVKRYKLQSDALIDEILRLFRLYGIEKGGVEQKSFEDLLKPWWTKRMIELQQPAILVELKDKGMRKEERIRGRLQAPFFNGKVWLKENPDDDTRELITELLKFPRYRYDDLCLIKGTKIATPFGDRNIENIKVGELVITPLGYRKVIASEFTGYKQTISRLGLEGTYNHPVFVHKKGFVNLDAVQYNVDRLCLRILIYWTLRNLWNLMESPTVVWEGKESIISLSQIPIREESVLRDFMLLYGKLLVERKYLKLFTFIIKTATHLTTIPIIWSAYRLGNTIQCLKNWIWLKCVNIWKRLDQWLQLDTEVQRAWSGIKNTVNNLGFQGNALELDVSGAGRSFGDGIKQQDFVLSIMERSTGERITPTGGKHYSKGGVRKPVYNLTVDDAHCFYANGILVGNCDALQYMAEIVSLPPPASVLEDLTPKAIARRDYERAWQERQDEGLRDYV